MAKRTLTAEQKQWVRDRDGGKCVLCGSTDHLHVHHVVGHGLLTFVGAYIETPLNLVTVCAVCHVLGRNGDIMTAIHPDISHAMNTYSRYGQGGFASVFDRRRRKLRREVTDKPLWNHEHDAKLQLHAIYATLEYLRVRPFPKDKESNKA